jgi:hypothetical protein
MFMRIALVSGSLVAFLATALVAAGPAAASTYIPLDDLNSQVRFDPNQGVIGWDVDGVNQLKLQGFWYRFEGMNQEVPLINLAAGGIFQPKVSDNDYDTGYETLNTAYDNGAGFSATVAYVLLGGLPGSHSSALQEIISFHNTTAQPVRLQFFQYCDFDLNGTAGDDTVRLTNPNTVEQRDAGTVVSETVVTPPPPLTEVALYAATLQKLNNTSVDNLDGSAGPRGPDDVTWAFQWDITVPVGGTVEISKVKNVTPEPATMALLGAGLMMVAVRVRRRLVA